MQLDSFIFKDHLLPLMTEIPQHSWNERKEGQVKLHLNNPLILHEQLLMEELLKAQFVITVLWKMKTEEQKSQALLLIISPMAILKKRKSYNAILANVCKASVPNTNELCP